MYGVAISYSVFDLVGQISVLNVHFTDKVLFTASCLYTLTGRYDKDEKSIYKKLKHV
jgi:hypothetical protein